MDISEKESVARGLRLSEGLLYAAILLALLIIFPTGALAAAQMDGGILHREISARCDLINVRLAGVTEYPLTEIFHDVLKRAPGVVEAKRYRFHLDPSRPADCIVEWAVWIRDTDPFQLQIHINEMVHGPTRQESTVAERGAAWRSGSGGLEQMKDIRPCRASSREIGFVLDRQRSPTPTGRIRPANRTRYWEGLPGAGFE